MPLSLLLALDLSTFFVAMNTLPGIYCPFHICLMNILCTGINHRIAPISMRERFALPPQEMDTLLHQIHQIEGLHEAVILSTCNRVEFYVATICPRLSGERIQDILSDRVGYKAPFYHHAMPCCVRHLFRVASGLDSMVLGETEVLGQVKRAYDKALRRGSTSRHLNKLFQYAFRVAKTVRSETKITHGPTSIGAVAVELAEKIFDNLTKCRVMILGAGETSKRTARSLISRGVQSTIVSNRTYERAAHLAVEVGGKALHFDQWQNALPEVDILISSTSAPYPILTSEQLVLMMSKREQRPIFIIDLAVPRDIEASVSSLENVFLYDIDSLQDIAQQSLSIRHCELKCCEALIEEHVLDFVAQLHRATWEDSRDLCPV